MSSSESLQKLSLIDLQQEVPPLGGASFEPVTTFERVESQRTVRVTPEEAHKNGLAEGEQLGRAAALKELEPVIEELRSVVAALGSVRQQRLDEVEGDLTELSANIAKRILHSELSESSDLVLRMTRACIEEAKRDGPLRLHVAPENLELVRTHLPEFELDLTEGEIQLLPDPTLERGSVVLETPRRCFDGRPVRVLEQAVEQLTSMEDAE